LWETGLLSRDEHARFQTASGLLTARRNEKEIELNFPATPPEVAEAPGGLENALGIEAKYVGKSRYDYLIEADAERVVRNLKPDFGRLRALSVRGIIVTSAAATEGFDFVSRFFAPGAGIDEDPVTGSAHCTLGPFWQERLKRDEMTAYQASARGGVIRVRVAGERVFLSGHAVTILRGELAF
jgi:predicted PhzF superfamily epimerase YddE/YHI9